MQTIRIDGALGGGQILRSSLSLSALTGTPFVIEHIRARRDRPGLMRQHLTAVRAASEICAAQLQGAELGSTSLEFRPGTVKPGSYRFAISTAGSACLVLQTVLPPLMVAQRPSSLIFEGGTHNPLAPPYPFLDRVFFPVLERMGVGLDRALSRAGFYPAGGGSFEVHVTPTQRLSGFDMLERGALKHLYAEALLARVPEHVGTRELAVVRDRLRVPEERLHLRTPATVGPGNALLIGSEHEHARELVMSIGQQGTPAERVAEQACVAMETYLGADVPVGEHLADQLLIPLAMAGHGSFRTLPPSDHVLTNMTVIERFLPVVFRVREQPGAALIELNTAGVPTRT